MKEQLADLWGEYVEYCKTVKYKTGAVITHGVVELSNGASAVRVEEVYATGIHADIDGFFRWVLATEESAV